MSIKKQEFYEGAALHQIACSSAATNISPDPPFFLINDCVLILLKYSTRNRSPWGFTFSTGEQKLLEQRSGNSVIVLGLICGSDGIAALKYDSYRIIANANTGAVHIACYRKRGEHYEVSGPNGSLSGKISPSRWRRIHLRVQPHETP